ERSRRGRSSVTDMLGPFKRKVMIPKGLCGTDTLVCAFDIAQSGKLRARLPAAQTRVSVPHTPCRLERPELNALRLLLRDLPPARRPIAVGPVVADAGDEERIVGTELAEGHAERIDVGAVVGLDDERRLEWQID